MMTGPRDSAGTPQQKGEHPPGSLLDYAQRYIAAGWAVLPLHGIQGGRCTCGKADCKSPGKHPRLVLPHFEQGVLDATTDLEAFAEAVDLFPQSNIGIRPPTSVMVIDVDPRNGGVDTLDMLESQHGQLPQTVEQITGSGGRHIVLQIPPGTEPPGKLGAGLDIKTHSGCIVAEPSMHVSGEAYGWEASSSLIDGVAIMPAPRWAVRAAAKAEQPVASVSTIVLDPGTLADLASALKAIDADDRDNWVRVGHALRQLGNDGRRLWDEWSQQSPKFDQADQDAKWKSFRPTEIGHRTVFHMAREAGWTGRELMIPAPAVPASGLLLSLHELTLQAAAIKWQVKHAIPDDAIGMYFGASGTFKSFIALDHALHVAHGLPWMGRKTVAGRVVYVAAEGGAGIARRVHAWHLQHGREQATNFHVCITPLILSLSQQVEMLATAIAELETPPRLVVIDTLSQTFAGDENSATDMAAYLRLLNASIRSRFGCTVIVIHHSGHAAAERPRGSSAILANVDFMFGVYRTDPDALSCHVEVVKQKDGDKIPSQLFEMQRHVVGADEDGEEVASLVACWHDMVGAVVATAGARLSAHEQAILGAFGGQAECYESTMRSALYEAMADAKPDTKKKAFKRSMESLVRKHLIEHTAHGVWGRVLGGQKGTVPQGTHVPQECI
jgi:hypothetical protein